MPPCSKLSRRGLETSECASLAERRPTLTASARAGVRNLRSGRKKACGAVKQKKDDEVKKTAGMLLGRRAQPPKAMPPKKCGFRPAFTPCARAIAHPQISVIFTKPLQWDNRCDGGSSSRCSVVR